jgi:hypothetical protein
MSQLIARILLTILLFPSATLVLFISFVFLEDLNPLDDEQAMMVSVALTCGYMIAYWVLLWRRAVVWTEARLWATFWACIIAAAIGIVLGVGIALVVTYNEAMLGTMLGGLAGAIVWMIATIVVWRETPAERGARLARAGADTLVCPACGYNLTGLRESRCPECGAAFTLNELLAAQPGRAADVEMERV